nr:unnamed protein product [Digitaria exilis]
MEATEEAVAQPSRRGGPRVAPCLTPMEATEEEEADADEKLSGFRKSLKRAKKYVDALHSQLEELVPLVSAVSGSAAGVSEEESARRPAKEMRWAAPILEGQFQELLASSEKQPQHALPSAAEEDDPSDDSPCPELPLGHPPYPKSGSNLSVGLPDRKTTIEAKLFHFSEHYDLAFLLLPMETSLVIPRFGCCPDYSQEVFVLGRDKDASLRVRRGVISWTEESDYIGCSHYMFLDGEVPEGGTGGPVVDHDGSFRGMAFRVSPMPAILSISTIMTCFEMFKHFG